jgi:hypothetical protein
LVVILLEVVGLDGDVNASEATKQSNYLNYLRVSAENFSACTQAGNEVHGVKGQIFLTEAAIAVQLLFLQRRKSKFNTSAHFNGFVVQLELPARRDCQLPVVGFWNTTGRQVAFLLWRAVVLQPLENLRLGGFAEQVLKGLLFLTLSVLVVVVVLRLAFSFEPIGLLDIEAEGKTADNALDRTQDAWM